MRLIDLLKAREKIIKIINNDPSYIDHYINDLMEVQGAINEFSNPKKSKYVVNERGEIINTKKNKIMNFIKKYLFVLCLFLSVSVNASETICRAPQGGISVKMPIGDNVSFNSSVHFMGHSNVPQSTNFNNWAYLFFDGNQWVQAPLNIIQGKSVYSNGNIIIDYVNLSGGSLYINERLVIKKFVANGGEIILAHYGVSLEIEGKNYCVGDKVKGVKIKVCNTVLPVGIENLKGIFKDGQLHVSWKSENEMNVAVYVVEISEDGNGWHYGGEVIAGQKVNYRTVIDNRIVYGSAALGLIFGSLFKRRSHQLIVLLFAVLFILGCSKSGGSDKLFKEAKFIRVKNIDIDQKEGFSKVVLIENEIK